MAQPMTITPRRKPMSTKTRDAILSHLIMCEINGTEVNSTSIAKKYRVTPMQVAGVRANLTRGAYGTMKSLTAQAKKHLNA